MGRKQTREELFKLLFEFDIKGELNLGLADDYISREENNFSSEAKSFIKKYYEGIVNKYENICDIIKLNMKSWTLDRIGTVERVLLIFAVYELTYENVEKEIVLNEVIEIAKKYGEDKSHEFINGVLAKVINNIE